MCDSKTLDQLRRAYEKTPSDVTVAYPYASARFKRGDKQAARQIIQASVNKALTTSIESLKKADKAAIALYCHATPSHAPEFDFIQGAVGKNRLRKILDKYPEPHSYLHFEENPRLGGGVPVLLRPETVAPISRRDANALGLRRGDVMHRVNEVQTVTRVTSQLNRRKAALKM